MRILQDSGEPRSLGSRQFFFRIPTKRSAAAMVEAWEWRWKAREASLAQTQSGAPMIAHCGISG